MKRGNMRVIYNGVAYECEVRQIPNNSLNMDEPLRCESGEHKLRVVRETIVPGEFETHGTLYLLCPRHLVYYIYNYTISHIELADRGAENA